MAMHRDDPTAVSHESSPAARGGAGSYIEGELGAFYLLALLADIEPRGLPGALIQRVRYQGVDQGFSLDDLVIHGTSHAGEMLLEIQSKRTISFSPKDKLFRSEEHTSELQSLMRISYAVFCLKKKKTKKTN